MPSVTLSEIIAEVANKIRDAIAPTVPDIQVEPRRNINPTAPSIDIYPGEPFRDDEGQGFGEVAGAIHLTVRARVSTVDYEANYDFLIELMDEESDTGIANILMDDQTLNGMASSVRVDLHSGIGFYEDVPGKGALPGCHWPVTVLRAHS